MFSLLLCLSILVSVMVSLVVCRLLVLLLLNVFFRFMLSVSGGCSVVVLWCVF